MLRVTISEKKVVWGWDVRCEERMRIGWVLICVEVMAHLVTISEDTEEET